MYLYVDGVNTFKSTHFIHRGVLILQTFYSAFYIICNDGNYQLNVFNAKTKQNELMKML